LLDWLYWASRHCGWMWSAMWMQTQLWKQNFSKRLKLPLRTLVNLLLYKKPYTFSIVHYVYFKVVYSSLIFSCFLNNIKQIHSIDNTFCQLFFKYVYECFLTLEKILIKNELKTMYLWNNLNFELTLMVENHDNIKIYEWKKIAKMHIVMVK